MSVLALMYHGTPSLGAAHWDVPLSIFRKQVDLMLEKGVEFIPFEEVNNPRFRQSSRSYVTITFDDGHLSNIDAIEYLSERLIRPIIFVVRSWAESGDGALGLSAYMREADLRSLTSICDFGSHGVTHRNLAELEDEALSWELEQSKAYLAQISGGTVDAIALPRAMGSERVIRMAALCGYRFIADGDFDINRRPASTIHRVVVNCEHGVDYPSRLASYHWLAWSARRQARRLYRGVRQVAGRRAAPK